VTHTKYVQIIETGMPHPRRIALLRKRPYREADFSQV
jgi:hypothetical protein